MKPRLLLWLVCPKCSGDLKLRPRECRGEEILSGTLLCERCSMAYPIKRSIPRFVDSDSYAESFSFEWSLHRRTQFDSEASNESERTFIEKTGFTHDELQGRLVLDVGCGAGRFAEVTSRWSAEVICVDLSQAVDVACENLGVRSNVHFVQADVFRLPFRRGSLDEIYSIGALHHTPDCQGAFTRLPGLLKPGGSVAVWVYSRELDTAGTRFWRRLTLKLPKRLLYLLCYLSVPLYHFYKIPPLRLLLRNWLPTSTHPNWRWRLLDTFDWYSPLHQSKHSYPEVYAWFCEAGLENIRLLDVPIALQGTLPLRSP